MMEGTMVKIPDIGPMATLIRFDGQMAEVSLMGNRFWIDSSLIENEEEDDDEEW